MRFFASLVSATDGQVDSIIVGGIIALLVLCGLSTWNVVELHNAFGPLDFATGCGAILGAIGGGKRLRDGPGPQ